MLKRSLQAQKKYQRGGCPSCVVYQGDGILDRVKDFKDTYGFWVGKGGSPTIDDRLNQFGIQSVELKQEGEGFWNSLLSVLSVLPIPVVSDIARTVSIVKTGVDKATGHHDPALGGIITKAMAPLADKVPEIGKPAVALAKSVGFGVENKKISPQQVGLYHLVDVLGKNLSKIKEASPDKRDAILETYRNLKKVLGKK